MDLWNPVITGTLLTRTASETIGKSGKMFGPDDHDRMTGGSNFKKTGERKRYDLEKCNHKSKEPGWHSCSSRALCSLPERITTPWHAR
jgi:hypothetical protein